MRKGFLFGIATALLLAGCSTAVRTSKLPPQPAAYVRIVNADSNLVQLQIAVREFVPARGKGPVVWLTGVSHLGEPAYYAALQKHLDKQTLVLFEGVGDSPGSKAGVQRDDPLTRPGTSTQAVSAKGSRSNLQSSLASSLGLVFQLEAIDYNRPNFRNSDLSVAELRDLIAERRASEPAGASQSFESLLQIMEGGSMWETILQMGMRFLGANPKLQGLSKLALIETLGQIKGDPSQLRGLPPQLTQLLEVLIQKRNQKVLADLKAQLKQMGRRGSVSIFYGTGHMPDLELRLRKELHYRPAQELWLTAFSVNLSQAGISQSERQFIRAFVKRELDEMQKDQMGFKDR